MFLSGRLGGKICNIYLWYYYRLLTQRQREFLFFSQGILGQFWDSILRIASELWFSVMLTQVKVKLLFTTSRVFQWEDSVRPQWAVLRTPWESPLRVRPQRSFSQPLPVVMTVLTFSLAAGYLSSPQKTESPLQWRHLASSLLYYAWSWQHFPRFCRSSHHRCLLSALAWECFEPSQRGASEWDLMNLFQHSFLPTSLDSSFSIIRRNSMNISFIYRRPLLSQDSCRPFRTTPSCLSEPTGFQLSGR